MCHLSSQFLIALRAFTQPSKMRRTLTLALTLLVLLNTPVLSLQDVDKKAEDDKTEDPDHTTDQRASMNPVVRQMYDRFKYPSSYGQLPASPFFSEMYPKYHHHHHHHLHGGYPWAASVDEDVSDDDDDDHHHHYHYDIPYYGYSTFLGGNPFGAIPQDNRVNVSGGYPFGAGPFYPFTFNRSSPLQGGYPYPYGTFPFPLNRYYPLQGGYPLGSNPYYGYAHFHPQAAYPYGGYYHYHGGYPYHAHFHPEAGYPYYGGGFYHDYFHHHHHHDGYPYYGYAHFHPQAGYPYGGGVFQNGYFHSHGGYPYYPQAGYPYGGGFHGGYPLGSVPHVGHPIGGLVHHHDFFPHPLGASYPYTGGYYPRRWGHVGYNPFGYPYPYPFHGGSAYYPYYGSAGVSGVGVLDRRTDSSPEHAKDPLRAKQAARVHPQMPLRDLSTRPVTKDTKKNLLELLKDSGSRT